MERGVGGDRFQTRSWRIDSPDAGGWERLVSLGGACCPFKASHLIYLKKSLAFEYGDRTPYAEYEDDDDDEGDNGNDSKLSRYRNGILIYRLSNC